MAHELIVYGDNDTTPLFAVGTAGTHANPFLQEPGEFSESEVDLLEGRAHIGFGSVSIIDPQTGATKQDRFLTALLGAPSGHSALIRRRAVLLTDGAVAMDGIVAGVTLNETFAGFTLQLADVRDRGVDVPVFTRASTSTVLPRGVLGGFGAMPSGEWLAPPVVPLKGRATRPTAMFASAFIYLDGGPQRTGASVPPELVVTGAMVEAVRPGPVSGAIFAAYDMIEVLWRAEGGGAYNVISNMPASFWPTLGPGVLETREGVMASPAGPVNVTGLMGIHLNGYNGEPLPAEGQRVEIIIRYVGPPTEHYPLHIERPWGEFATAIMAGDYSHRPDGTTISPRLRYNAAAWLADTTPCRARITKPVDDVRTALEQMCKARGAAPGMNAAGEIVPIFDRMPDAAEVLPQIDDSNCTAVAGWDHPAAGAVTAVEVQYPRVFRVPATADPQGSRSGGDGLASRDVIVRYQADTTVTDVMGEQDVVQVDAWMHVATGTPEGSAASGDVQDETGAQIAKGRARLTLDRFSYGAQSGYVRLAATDFPTLALGGWVTDARSWVPDYLTGKRQGNALAQVVSMRRVSDKWLECRIVYAGPADMPLSPPTFGTATVNADGIVSVPITAVPSAGGATVNVDVEYAVSPGLPAANSGEWTHMGRLRYANIVSLPYTLTSPALPAGSTCWLRGRASMAGVRASAWVSIGFVSTPQTPRLISATLRLSGGVPSVSWHANAFTLGVRLEYAVHDGSTPEDEWIWDSVDVAASEGTATLAAAVPVFSSVTVDATPWSGFAGSAVSGDAGVPFRLTATRSAGTDALMRVLTATLDTDEAGDIRARVRLPGSLASVRVALNMGGHDTLPPTDAEVDAAPLHAADENGDVTTGVLGGAGDGGRRVMKLRAFTEPDGTGEAGPYEIFVEQATAAENAHLDRVHVVRQDTPPADPEDTSHIPLAGISFRVKHLDGRGGIVRVWTNKASSDSANPDATPDGVVTVPSTPYSFTPATVFDGGATPLTAIPNRTALSQKTVYLEFVPNGESGVGQLAVALPYMFTFLDPNGTLRTDVIIARHIKTDTLEARHIKTDTIEARHIKTDTIEARHIKAGVITADKIVAGTITADKIVAGTITAAYIAADAIEAHHIKAGVINATHIAAGTITATQIGLGAITGDRISNTTITGDKIVQNSVNGDRIANTTLSAGKLVLRTITGDYISETTIDGGHIITGSIVATHIAADQINTGHLQANSVTSSKIQVTTLSSMTSNLGTVTAGSIAGDSGRVTFDLNAALLTILDAQGTPLQRVRMGKLGVGTQDYGLEIRDASNKLILGATGLGTAVVGTSNIVDLAIDASKLADYAVDTSKIVDEAISAQKIAAGSVTANKINVTSLSAIAANVGVLTAGQIRNAANTVGVAISGGPEASWVNYWDMAATGSYPVVQFSEIFTIHADGTGSYGESLLSMMMFGL
jgi:hypothetical protein